jgi:hypothetical protein
MAFTPVESLRAIILILAMAFGLAGQTFAPPAMTMQIDNGPLAAVSTGSSGMCPGCAGIGHSTPVPADCSVGLCSGAVAVLQTPAARVGLALRATFAGAVFNAEHGISIPPDPGPPRFLRLS